MTLDQGDYCREQGLDAQDPPCGRVILTGTSVSLEKGSVEYEFAKESMFFKHPGKQGVHKAPRKIRNQTLPFQESSGSTLDSRRYVVIYL